MSESADHVPSHIGRFVVESVLGAGGMGAVYKATDPTLKRLVAVKTVRPDISDPVYLQRLVDEAQACARLHHPHIVTVHEAGEIEGGAYVVMEYLEGEDLAQALWRGELPFEQRVRILIQILEALEHAHANGVIHRDIKPANIRVLANGNIKIVDFGLARMTQVDSRTVTGTILGTLHYASPEQLRGEKVDGRTDIYSTGTMAYEMCSGRKPFDGDTISTIIIKVIQDPVPPMNAQWSRAFPEIEKIIARAMAKNADERYQTAREMRDALTAFLANSRDRLASSAAHDTMAGQQTVIQSSPSNIATGGWPNQGVPTKSVPAATPARSSQPAAPARPWLVPAAAVLALGVIGAAGYAMMSGRAQAEPSTIAAADTTPPASPPSLPASSVATPPISQPAATEEKRETAAAPAVKAEPPKPNSAPATPPATTAVAPAPVAAASGREMFYATASGSADAPNTGLRYRITQQTKDGHEADVDIASATFRAGDKVRLSFESNVDGYLYVVQQGSSGRWSVLFPSPEINGGRNRVRKSDEYMVPDDGWFEFDSNPGAENLFVFFSREPMQALPGFSKPVTRSETLTASAVSELQGTIASRDLSFSRDSKAAVKAGNLIQANYVVNKSELGKAVSVSFVLRHEP